MAVINPWTTGPLRNNPSGSFQFVGMNNLRNNAMTVHNKQELLWHAAIDLAWAQANQAQRNDIRAFCARWGPRARPHNPAAGTEDFLRFKFWAQNNRVPKCPSCAFGHAAMPGAPALNTTVPSPIQVPIGLDTDELMPCGCTEEEEGLYEVWAIGTDVWNKTQVTQGRTKPAAMGRDVRECMMRSFKMALGMDIDNDLLNFDLLVDRNERVTELGGNTDPNIDDEDTVTAFPNYF